MAPTTEDGVTGYRLTNTETELYVIATANNSRSERYYATIPLIAIPVTQGSFGTVQLVVGENRIDANLSLIHI